MSRQGDGLTRSIGLAGLTFVAVTSMVGSGWLFAPQLAAQAAGPAAILAWGLGGLAVLVVALTFAEVSAVLPLSGGVARIPQTTHGAMTGMLMGWTAWIGYAAIVAIEVLILLRYLAPLAPWIFQPGADTGSAIDFTVWGWLLALLLMALITLAIAFGAALFARINNLLTLAKLALPIVIGVALLSVHYDATNFTAHGGFSPYGLQGLFAALSTGGVIFSFMGFRNVVDLAGEARNPQVTIPASLLLGLLVAFLLYAGLQTVLITSLPAEALSEGWSRLHMGADLGPFAAIAAASGLVTVGVLIHVAAILSPFGTGLGMMGSSTRLVYGMSRSHTLPHLFGVLARGGIPVAAIAINLALSIALLFLPFDMLVTLTTAAVAVSMVAGPIALHVFRLELPGYRRAFRVPLAPLFGYAGILVVTLIVYWGGWDTVRLLLGLVLLGAVLHPFLRQAAGGPSDWRRALWLLPWLGGLAGLSWAGNFGGGQELVPFGWDLVAAAAIAGIAYALALRSRRRRSDMEAMLAHHGLHEDGQDRPER